MYTKVSWNMGALECNVCTASASFEVENPGDKDKAIKEILEKLEDRGAIWNHVRGFTTCPDCR